MLEFQQVLRVYRVARFLLGLDDVDPYQVQIAQGQDAKLVAQGVNPAAPVGAPLLAPVGTSFSGGVTTGTNVQLVCGPGGVPTLPAAHLAAQSQI